LTDDGGATHNHVILTLAPPRPPSSDELEALIREARARQRKRWVGAAAIVAVLAGASLGIHSIATGTHAKSSVAARGGTQAAATGPHCGFRVAGTRVLASDGSVAYRDPSKSAMWHELQCSGSAVWVVFVNRVGMMHEEYVGARSLDRGRTWRVVLADRPGSYGIGAEVGAWTLRGSHAAYFLATCPACSVGKAFGTVSLTVTKNAGRTFRSYPVSALSGFAFAPLRLRARGSVVTIWARRLVRKVGSREVYRRKVVRMRVA
jgi:hypothetical protein